jgi:hypothetical protein
MIDAVDRSISAAVVDQFEIAIRIAGSRSVRQSGFRFTFQRGVKRLR